MFSNNQKGLIRGLIYCIQFSNDPVNGVDHVFKVVVDRRAMDASREEYAAAVDAALSSDEPLSQLIPQPHSEAVIRAFLAAVQKRFADEPSQAG
jgi:hypothetical protein